MKDRFSFCQWALLIAFLVTTNVCFAVMPPRPGSDARFPDISERLRTAGFGQHSRPELERQISEGVTRSDDLGPALSVTVTGTRYLPVLMGDTSDMVGTHATASLEAELFGNWPTGSMTDYYEEISYGQFQVTGSVYGWYRLPQTMSYYQGASGCNGLCAYPTCAGKFVRDLVGLADAAGVDWSNYDNDGPDGVPNSGDDDGYVDTIVIVHSGSGGECGGNDFIWSHSFFLRGWGIPAFTTSTPSASGGNIKIDDYIIQPEVSCYGGMIEIGVFCHEYGHALGLPDLYDTSGNGNGIGSWGVMASGSWGGDGASPELPVHMSAWSKMTLGWVTPTVVPWDDDYDLSAVELAPTVLQVWSDGQPGTEYFLVENRQKTLNDSKLPLGGLNIWHIDEDVINDGWPSNEVNAGAIYGVALEQADGLGHLESKQNRGDTGDPWPGSSGNTTFTNSTNPSSRDNSSGSTDVQITSISGPVMTMSAHIEVGVPTVDTTSPQVTVLLPNGGENWAAGAAVSVTWTASDNVGVDHVDIWLSYDDGKTFPQLLVGDLPNSGSWLWQLPVAVYSDLMIQIVAEDAATNTGDDVSDGSFQISDQYPPVVAVTQPAGGEVWDTSSTQTISWTAADNIGVAAIDIFLSTDGGLTWPDTVAYGLPHTGNYLWTVPGQIAPESRLKLQVRDAAGLTAESESELFTITNITAVVGMDAPSRLRLGPGVPNPFNPLTTIHYFNPRSGRLDVVIYDLLGRKVRSLVSEVRPTGTGSVQWNGRDQNGRSVASGIYYVQATAAGQRSYMKVTLVR